MDRENDATGRRALLAGAGIMVVAALLQAADAFPYAHTDPYGTSATGLLLVALFSVVPGLLMGVAALREQPGDRVLEVLAGITALAMGLVVLGGALRVLQDGAFMERVAGVLLVSAAGEVVAGALALVGAVLGAQEPPPRAARCRGER